MTAPAIASHSDDRSPLAQGIQRRRDRSVLAAATWIVSVTILLWFASIQVHPAATENAIVAGVLLLATGVSVCLAPTVTLVRFRRLIAMTALTMVAIGLWNPWHLAAVSLLLAHPVTALICLAAIDATTLQSRRTGRSGTVRSMLFIVGWVVLVMAASVAGIGMLVFSPGAHEAYYGDGGAPVRIAHHDKAEQGRQRTLVLRSGYGLLMRERVLATGWWPNSRLIGNDTAVIGCKGGPIVIRFDPETLEVLDRAGNDCDGG